MQARKIVSTIEARMTSTRLPGKVMKPILGKPVLELLVERLKSVELINEIVIATTVNRDDDVIEELGRKIGVKVFRGSENDVLGRVLAAAQGINADLIVEITGDCPFIDPAVARECIKLFLSGDYDYVSNGCRLRTFPDGLAVQVFPVKVLEEVNSLTSDAIYREHPSYYIYTHPEKYKLKNYPAQGELCWPELAISLDTPQDYELIKIIFEELYPKNPLFSAFDIVRFLRSRPELLKINDDPQRRRKYIESIPRSLKNER
jgi:spore coat polysaccharide biosynthesis protein SpsF